MVVTQDDIVAIIRRYGPLIPSKLAKQIGTDILIASAHLANVVDNKKALISNVKVGGSPVYYLEGQEAKLQDYISNLNDKDQKTFNLLKEKKILRDDTQDPLTRVSLRTIKDFAIPLQVTKNNEKFLFWKWYLISNKEAEDMIKEELEIKEPKPIEVKKPEEKIEEKKIDHQYVEEKKKIEEEKKKIEEERKKFQEEKQKLKKQLELERQTMLKEAESKKKEIKKQQEPEDKSKDDLFKKLTDYFKDRKIELVEYKIIRKNAEIDLIVKVPSVVGEIEYLCKAKNKRSISDSDISTAVVQGQLKKLPVLLLTTGELNKKAKELLKTELGKGIIIKKV